jgi:sigma-B regulation protein RsbU (phosphoserine phosphatase)
VLIRKDGTLERLGEGGIVLGVLPDATYDEVELPFAPGDRLVLFTDGITEANDARDDEFGMDRLIELLISHRTQPASQMLGAILHSVGEFTAQGFQDDATVLIITME